MPNKYKFSKTKGHKNEDQIFSAEADFEIKIENSEFEYWKYRDTLYDSVSQRNFIKYVERQKFEKSPFERFVHERVKQIVDDENSLIFVSNYTEKEGSFIITFSLFVFATFMNYGQFRESLDYLREDLNFLLANTYPSNTRIAVDYNTRRNKILSNIQRSVSNQALVLFNNEFKKLKRIVLLIGIVALGFSAYAIYKLETRAAPITIDQQSIQNSIRTEIDRINSEQINEELLKMLQKLNSDSSNLRQ